MDYSHLIQTPFLARPSPYKHESALGYLVRIAEDNGWPSLESLIRHAPVTSDGSATYLRHIVTSAERMQLIERLLVKPANSVTNLAYANVSQGRSTIRQFRHTVLSGDMFEFQVSRFCPACLELSPYRRDLWDLAPVWSCPDHDLLLQQCCPHCGAEQSWTTTRTTTCGKCYSSLLDAPRENASMGIRWLSNLIARRLDALNQPPVTNFIPADPGILLEVVRLLMLFVSGEGCKGRDLPALPPMPPDAAQSAYEKVAVSLQRWPHAATDIVRDQVAQQWRRYPALGPQSWEKRVQRILSRRDYLDSSYFPWTAPLRDSLAAIKSSVDMPHGRDASNNTSEPAIVETDLLSYQESAKLLGISLRTMRLASTLASLESMGLIITIRSTRWIDGKKLDTLFENIQHSICARAAVETISLANMQTTILGRNGRNVFDIVQAILNGKLSPVCWPRGTPLSRMEFDLLELKQFLGEVATNFDGYTIPDAAKKLRCLTDALRRVIKAGVLQASWVRCADGHHRTIVAGNDLDRFQQEYAFSATLAKEHNDEPRRFSEKLMDEGIKPVSGPGIDGGLMYLFNRKDINNIDLRAVAKKTVYKKRCGRKIKKDVNFLEQQFLKEALLTSAAVATMLGISTQIVSQLAKRGYLAEFKHYGKFGNRRYFRTEEIKRYIAEYRDNPTLVLEHEAARLLDISLHRFRSTMITTRKIIVITDGLNRYVKRADLLADFSKPITK